MKGSDRVPTADVPCAGGRPHACPWRGERRGAWSPALTRQRGSASDCSEAEGHNMPAGGRNDTVPLCSWHGYLHGKSRGVQKQNKHKTTTTAGTNTEIRPSHSIITQKSIPSLYTTNDHVETNVKDTVELRLLQRNNIPGINVRNIYSICEVKIIIYNLLTKEIPYQNKSRDKPWPWVGGFHIVEIHIHVQCHAENSCGRPPIYSKGRREGCKP